jgi:hypothetical protein
VVWQVSADMQSCGRWMSSTVVTVRWPADRVHVVSCKSCAHTEQGLIHQLSSVVRLFIAAAMSIQTATMRKQTVDAESIELLLFSAVAGKYKPRMVGAKV